MPSRAPSTREGTAHENSDGGADGERYEKAHRHTRQRDAEVVEQIAVHHVTPQVGEHHRGAGEQGLRQQHRRQLPKDEKAEQRQTA
jgi:hypothetical protein